jgi:hypothetical protein
MPIPGGSQATLKLSVETTSDEDTSDNQVKEKARKKAEKNTGKAKSGLTSKHNH